jgi:hypothetical protein
MQGNHQVNQGGKDSTRGQDCRAAGASYEISLSSKLISFYLRDLYGTFEAALLACSRCSPHHIPQKLIDTQSTAKTESAASTAAPDSERAEWVAARQALEDTIATLKREGEAATAAAKAALEVSQAARQASEDDAKAAHDTAHKAQAEAAAVVADLENTRKVNEQLKQRLKAAKAEKVRCVCVPPATINGGYLPVVVSTLP